MNIVIVGAGDIGLHCANVLSKEGHNVVLVDKDSQLLEMASRESDVATRVGTGTDWQLLEELTEIHPDLFLALTEDDEDNIVACAIAKNLGYKQTVAFIKHSRYLNCSRVDFGRVFYVDHFISPALLTSENIFQKLLSPGSISIESFAHGAIQMRTLCISDKWRKGDQRLQDLDLPKGLMIGLISRPVGKADDVKYQCIFPHGNDHIQTGDEVTVIGERDVVLASHQFFGSNYQPIKSAVIIGGSRVGFHLAKALEHQNINIRLIDKDFNKCCSLSERLPYSTILHHDGCDIEFLKSEKIDRADALITCSEDDETNFLAAMLGKEAGCENVMVVSANTRYFPIIQRLGIVHAVSPRLSSINRILSIAQKKTVTSIVSMYEDRAEVMELRISANSIIAGIPISELGPQLPKDFLIAVIQNRGRIMVANGNRILTPGDTVIAITHPRHLKDLESLF
ncbi:Uncharacterized protein SCG7109_AE_00330 [Chlamydiales bacterium SCGC AG-110-M15]|nr:Uncharacterized protein SCG7109_AE_00330 [Chlamydiales bacterium SCGC AG-110-M15]